MSGTRLGVGRWWMMALALTLLLGCSSGDRASPRDEPPVVGVATLKGPTGVGMVHLMEADSTGTAANDYSFQVSESPEQVAAKVAAGEVDLAAVPTNLGAALYAKTSGGVQMLAVNTLGVMYVLEDGDSVDEIADLKGRTVYATGQGSNPEYVLRFLLRKNGLDPDTDVHIVFKSEHAELATLTAGGKAGIALLPEPFVTTVTLTNPRLRVALDLSAEWAKVVTDGSRLMMGGVIARTEFVRKNPAAVSAFLAEYRAAIEKATADADATAALCVQFGIIPKAAVAKAALPRLGLTYLEGEEMATGLRGYYQVLYDANPTSVAGALPDSGFYFTKQ